jgi:hypothetical protein
MLPGGNPRFCIECGHRLRDVVQPEAVSQPAAGEQVTVRLPNARVEQRVIGGTIRLPSSGAIPPGMWVLDEPPDPQTIVAIYAPLRAVVGGWSGLSGHGWRRGDRSALRDSRMAYTFTAERVWFPAPGCGGGMRLHITIAAIAESVEGRSRLGFRSREGDDPPMQVIHAAWRNQDGEPVQHPIPDIQIMAPPRVPRVSDVRETITVMRADEARRWLAGSAIQGTYRLLGGDVQQRTPAGRGLLLVEVEQIEQHGWWQRLFAWSPNDYHVRMEQPFTVVYDQWRCQVDRMQREAASVGLDMETDAVVEWWFDRYNDDGVIFTHARQRYRYDRVVVVFRRSQVVRVQR